MKNNINEKKIKNNKQNFERNTLQKQNNWCNDKISEEKISTKYFNKKNKGKWKKVNKQTNKM